MSGIYIHGMEMPKCCLVCTFNYDMYVCELLGVSTLVVQDGEKIPICPLISVPDHGRLVDADEFEKFECNACDGACDVVGCDCTNCDKDCRCDFMLDIHNAPTIIPADKGGAE